jgi:hypothetical protein
MRSMAESYVDLTYRGLAFGQRVKLTQVRPTTGYLELPAPMPVGTSIGIATEDGVTMEATVAEVHEQAGASDHPPGMVVRPRLEGGAASWWKERVELPEDIKIEVAPAVGIVRAKRKSQGAVPELIDDGRNTAVMDAVDPGISGELRSSSSGELRTGREAHDTQVVDVPQDAKLVDDGKRTIAMAAVDLEALGLDPSASQSGPIPAAGDGDGDDDSSGDDKSATKAGGRKKRKRR